MQAYWSCTLSPLPSTVHTCILQNSAKSSKYLIKYQKPPKLLPTSQKKFPNVFGGFLKSYFLSQWKKISNHQKLSNTSENLWIPPKTFKNLWKSSKTSNNLLKPTKTSENLWKPSKTCINLQKPPKPSITSKFLPKPPKILKDKDLWFSFEEDWSRMIKCGILTLLGRNFCQENIESENIFTGMILCGEKISGMKIYQGR